MVATRLLVLWILLLGSFAHADKAARPKKMPSVVARVVSLEIYDDETAFITVTAGSEQGVGKLFRARFREGTTSKLLAGGNALLIRVDRRTTTLKTKLSPAQIRANKFVQLDP